MSDIEARLRAIEDRAAIEDVLLAYYAAVDSMCDLDGLVDCFTSDAVLDVGDLGLSRLVGHDAIRAFFAGVFRDTAHHAHHISNVRISRLECDEATAHGYVFAKAKGVGGLELFVHCKYDIELVRTAAGWKMCLFDEDAQIPIGDEVSALHAGH